MSARREVRAGGLAAVFAACALAAALLLAIGVAPTLAAALAAPVFLAGAAFPLLAAVSPSEPSAAKLGLLAWLVSPCWLAALFALARLALPAPEAAAAALAATALAQPLARRVALRFESPGGAAIGAWTLGALLGAGVVILHAAVPVLRQMGDGLWHAGLIAAVDRELAPANPWLAATPVAHPLAYHVLADLVERLFHLAPTAAPGVLAAWAAAALPPALYFLAAPLWEEPRRALLAPLVALAGWNAAGGLLWIARGLPFAPPADAAGWVAQLGAALPEGGPSSPTFGGAALLLPGPFPVALALAAGGWFCDAHALRHGRMPWVVLAPLLHALAILADPGVGLGAAGAAAAAALAAPGRAAARPAVLLGLVVACFPAAVASRGSGLGPELGALPRWGAPEIALAACLPALALLLPLLGRPTRAAPRAGRRSLVALLAAGVVVPIALGSSLEPPGALPGGALRLAGFALGSAAVGPLVGAWESGRRAARAAAGALGLALLGGGLANAALVVRDSLALRSLDPGLREVPFGVESTARELPLAYRVRAPGEPPPTSPPLALDADSAAMYAWIRRELPEPWRRGVLLVGEGREVERLPQAPAPHPASLFTGLDLWADRSEPSARSHPRLAPRVRAARELFEARAYAGPAIEQELEQLGRPGLVLGPPAGGGAALEGELARLGFQLVHEQGAVRLWGWSPSTAGSAR